MLNIKMSPTELQEIFQQEQARRNEWQANFQRQLQESGYLLKECQEGNDESYYECAYWIHESVKEVWWEFGTKVWKDAVASKLIFPGEGTNYDRGTDV